MNKLIIFACLIVAITPLCVNGTATKVDECKGKELDPSEKTGGADTCCFFTYTNTEKKVVTQCLFIEKKKVLDQVKAGKKTDDKYSIDCASNWLSFSLYLVALIFMI